MSLNFIIILFLKILVFTTFGICPLSAFNGILQPSFGARQAGMGGAFQAVGGSVMDLESNPSHLGRLKQAKWEIGSAFHSARIEYQDKFIDPDISRSYSNSITENPKAVLPYAGIISPLTDRIGIGFAVYFQGGGGGFFRGVSRLTPDGKTLNESFKTDIPVIGCDRTVSETVQFRFMSVKSTLGFGMSFGKFSFGVGLDAVYGMMQFNRLQHDRTGTFELPGSFRYSGDNAYSWGGKIGLSYSIFDNIRFAYSYVSGNSLPLDGTLHLTDFAPEKNFGTRVSRMMKWPDRHTAGISFQSGNFLISFDIKYILWRESFRTGKFFLENAWLKTPFGTDSNAMQMNFYWKNQTVFSAGTEYKWNESISLRAGYNYGKNPIPERGVSPMLGSSIEHHISCGAGIGFGSSIFHIALEYGLPKKTPGGKFSDWTVSHSVFSTDEKRIFQYDYSKTMSVISIYFGIENSI